MENLCDPAAERAVIAGVCSHGSDSYLDVADIVTTRTMTIDSNQSIWACIKHIFDNDNHASIDYPSIMSAASSLGLSAVFDRDEEQKHLRAVMNFPVKQENVRRLAARIRRLEIARLLTGQLDEAKKNVCAISGDEPIGNIISLAEGPIFDFSSLLTNTNEGPQLMGTKAREYAQFLMDNPRQMMGISTGLSKYDESIGGGLRVNSLDIIAARAKTGKTFVTDNVGLYIAGESKIPVFNLDTEMSREEHQHRVLSILSGVEIRDIETGKCGKNDLSRQQVLDAADKLSSMPYWYECIIGKPFEEVMATLRRWVTRTVGLDDNGKAKPCVIIYDYLKMMSGDFVKGDMQEYQALGFITTALKNFMGRYSVPCLCFAQLNRTGIDGEDESSLSGSDRIVHYCTSLTYYKKKADEERAEAAAFPGGQQFTHKLLPVVSRHGEKMEDGDYINIRADYKRGRIIEGPTRNELARGIGVKNQPQGIIIDDAAQEPVPFAA
jgi:replicative DNA helicase